MVDIETLADAILDDLKSVFGPTVFSALMLMIADDFLGEMDVRTAIMERPDLFERAFIGTLGTPGEKILADICEGLCTRFLIDRDVPGLDTGNLAKCMTIIPKSG